jgi:hypothetical protein
MILFNISATPFPMVQPPITVPVQYSPPLNIPVQYSRHYMFLSNFHPHYMFPSKYSPRPTCSCPIFTSTTCSCPIFTPHYIFLSNIHLHYMFLSHIHLHYMFLSNIHPALHVPIQYFTSNTTPKKYYRARIFIYVPSEFLSPITTYVLCHNGRLEILTRNFVIHFHRVTQIYQKCNQLRYTNSWINTPLLFKFSDIFLPSQPFAGIPFSH